VGAYGKTVARRTPFEGSICHSWLKQIPGHDFEETFAPTLCKESLRRVVSLIVTRNMSSVQMDVKTAFLNGRIDRKIISELPEIIFDKQFRDKKVALIKKAIYGLRQSLMLWSKHFENTIRQIGLVKNSGDPCLYHKKTSNGLVLLAVYVDDIILAAESQVDLQDFKRKLEEKFQMTSLGGLKYILGIEVVENFQSMHLCQKLYVEQLRTRFGIQECNSDCTMAPGVIIDTSEEISEEEKCDGTWYRSLVGGLNYLATCTRLDIAFSVNVMARRMVNPSKSNAALLLRVLKYVISTSSTGLM
jgi:Reverse transcriptase (RNA-dependent DNA polymerase)